MKTFKHIGIALLIFVSGCVIAQPTPPAQPRLSITSEKGHVYELIETGESDRFTESVPRNFFFFAKPAASADDYNGKDRAAAKTSIANAPLQAFSDWNTFFSKCIVDDEQMRSHQPPITTSPTPTRVAEEQKNVSLNGFVLAVKKEADNDYHLIVGDLPAPAHLLNVEVTGLPTDPVMRQKLAEPRQTFKDFFKDKVSATSYLRCNPGIPVHLEGSLFYDIDHPPGAVGPRDLAPKTSWEIHPVSKIVFEP